MYRKIKSDDKIKAIMLDNKKRRRVGAIPKENGQQMED